MRARMNTALTGYSEASVTMPKLSKGFASAVSPVIFCVVFMTPTPSPRMIGTYSQHTQ